MLQWLEQQTTTPAAAAASTTLHVGMGTTQDQRPNPTGRGITEKEKSVVKSLGEHGLKKYKEKVRRRGVVYLSRLPPTMKPQKVRHLLEHYGEIGRVYLAAEDSSIRRNRKNNNKEQKGDKKTKGTSKRYTEGWVEFEDKTQAKLAAQLLNGQPMGGKKRSSTYYDLWCIKYLSKFSWDHLTEELNHQRAVMDQKIAAEVAAAHRERDFYLSRVDKAKAVESIIQRKKGVPVQDNDHDSSRVDIEQRGPKRKRTFGQKQAKDATKELSSSLLAKLAGS